ncbi:MAG: SRPBCC family protein [Pseudomonadales bacterium]|nr:SRPBCC family protein [Pseudomonadales bacterium]
MSRQQIHIQQSFNAPVDTIFGILSDHVQLGDILSAEIKRVVDSDSDNVNGLGSVRKLTIFPTPSFEETVTAFEPNKLIEYRITKGSPLKNHVGTMQFSTHGNQTHLDYRIEFEPKIGLPLFGSIVKFGLETAISRGLAKLANSLK